MFNLKVSQFINTTKDVIAKAYLHTAVIVTVITDKVKTIINNLLDKTKLKPIIEKITIPTIINRSFEALLIITLIYAIITSLGFNFFVVTIIGIAIYFAITIVSFCLLTE